MLKPTYDIPDLPLKLDLETPLILKTAAHAHRHLAELKGRASNIPNQGNLIDTLSLQEAKASSEVENIVTTHDELFQASLFPDNPASAAAKEVALYRDALRLGHELVSQQKGILTNNTIIALFQKLKRTEDGFRRTPGTALKNEASGELVYIPPQDGNEIANRMKQLESFINENELCGLDPLIKMAIIHHQFESIYPFSDGNGRIGRIINVLYLTTQDLLDIPILYLSRYITTNKGDYYRLLQAVRERGAWEEWVVYMLRAVADTSLETLRIIEQMRRMMADYKNLLRTNHKKLYSLELLNSLFRHPYTRIEYIQKDLDVSRQTASKYLDQLVGAGMLSKHKLGKNNYYVNDRLAGLFLNAPAARSPNQVPEQGVSAYSAGAGGGVLPVMPREVSN